MGGLLSPWGTCCAGVKATAHSREPPAPGAAPDVANGRQWVPLKVPLASPGASHPEDG